MNENGSQTNETKTTAAQPAPTFEQQPEPIPEMPIASFGEPDLIFVIDVMSKCIAAKFADGGDTRYTAQNAFVTAREALGVLVAAGAIQSTTIIRGPGGQNEPLWKNPAVPPMGQVQTRPQM